MGIPLTNSNICWDENPFEFENAPLGAFFYLFDGLQYALILLLGREVNRTLD